MMSIIRICVVGLAVIAEFILLGLLVISLQRYSYLIFIGLEVVSIIAALVLANGRTGSSYTTAWLFLILILPVFGFLLYLLWGRSGTDGKKSKKLRVALERGQYYQPHEQNTYRELATAYPELKKISVYLKREGYPLYHSTACRYFSLGEKLFEFLLTDLATARHYIFLEFFIVADGKIWRQVHRILKEKAAQGVDVRLMLDDFGSLMTLPNRFVQSLAAENIRCVRFNPVHKYVSRLYLNYRNHQKIAVIDGNIGYTGGINLADEYANIYVRYGHWKDTGIRLEGDAVYGLTSTFLQMWEGETGQPQDYGMHRPTRPVRGAGFFQPFADGPVNNPKNPAETTYRQIISGAQNYVYITTPYLVIDNVMLETLRTAAQSGVDVRILTPKIWDHWYVHIVTRSNYQALMQAGIRIYEYTPGYIHTKTILCDDNHAVTGSINMDYRSFYLHFENGVYICGDPVLKEIKRDILDTMDRCEEISMQKWSARPWHVKAIESILRLFAPLL